MRHLLAVFAFIAILVPATAQGQVYYDINSGNCTGRGLFPSAVGCYVQITTVSSGDYALDGEPECTDDFNRGLQIVERAVAAYGATSQYGPYVAAVAAVVGALSGSIGGEAGRAIDGIIGGQRYASCKVMGMVFPANTRFSRRNNPETGQPESVNPYDSFTDEDSWYGPVGFGNHPGDGWKRIQSAGIERTNSGYALVAIVKNWSHNRSVDARLVVFVDVKT